TTGFLEILPNASDDLLPFYKPILRALVAAFKSQPLVPVDRGGHAPGSALFKGPARIREGITSDSLAFFTSAPKAQWVAGVMENKRADKFLEALSIREWGWSELRAAMRAKFGSADDSKGVAWLRSKNDEWLQSFYAVLKQMLSEESLYDE